MSSEGAALRSDRAPTVKEWELEIESVITGRRDSDLRYLGTADEYVRVAIANSTDPVASRINFREALDRVVQFWQPNPVAERLRTLQLLDIVRAWTPPQGFDKTLDLMRRWGMAALDCELPMGGDRKVDLRRRALSVLEKYFLAPPLKPNGAFLAYVDLLESHLERDNFRIYAARRLSELGVINLNDDSLIGILDRYPLATAAFVELSIEDATQEQAEASLTSLYAKCKAHGHLRELSNGVEALGGEVGVYESRVVEIHLRGFIYRLNQSNLQIVKGWSAVTDRLSQEINRIQESERLDAEKKGNKKDGGDFAVSIPSQTEGR